MLLLVEVNTKAIFLKKTDDLEYDLGHLCGFDFHPLDVVKLKKNREKHLASVSRDNVQLLFNQIFALPTERLPNNEGIIATLPSGKTKLPRQKHLPEPKAPTRWEQFAAIRQIQKRKRDRLVWDDVEQKWKPRWGYNRANNELDDWLIEESGEVGTDPWIERKKAKQQRVAKQTKQELRNKKEAAAKQTKHASAQRGSEKLVSLLPEPSLVLADDSNKVMAKRADQLQIESTLSQANQSTASLGRFNKALPGERPYKLKPIGTTHKKRPITGNMQEEKQTSLKVMEKLFNTSSDTLNAKKQPIDVSRATREIVGQKHKQNTEKRMQRVKEQRKKTYRKKKR